MYRKTLNRIARSMPKGLKTQIKSILPDATGPQIQRFLASYPSHLIVSYPKCGRTWLRLLVSHAVYYQFPPAPTSDDMFLDLRRLHQHCTQFPDLAVSHDDCQFNTVEGLERDKRKYQKTHIALLVRDPRDVIVSWFFHVTYRKAPGLNGEQQDEVRSFLFKNCGGLKTLIEFMNIWADQRQLPTSFLLMKYEDLCRDPKLELMKFFKFLGCANVIEPKAIERSINYNEFDRMKERERKGAFSHNAMSFSSSDDRSFKTRRGQVGGYRDYLSQDDCNYLDRYIADNLDPYFGY